MPSSFVSALPASSTEPNEQHRGKERKKEYITVEPRIQLIFFLKALTFFPYVVGFVRMG